MTVVDQVNLPARVQLALGADLTADPSTWVWTTMGSFTHNGQVRERLLAQPVPIGAGRKDQSQQPSPADLTVELDNSDGALTPYNAASPYWPHIGRGTSIRHQVWAGLPYLAFTGLSGSRLTTPNHSSLNFTGDRFLAIELEPPLRVPASNAELWGMYNASGNQRQMLIYLGSDRKPRVRWSTDGAIGTEQTRTASVAVPLIDTKPLCLAAWLDVNDGGAHSVTFYAAETLEEILDDLIATILGVKQTQAGTTSVHAGTSALEAGDLTGSGFSPYPGRFRRAQMRNGGPTGTIVANPDVRAIEAGQASFTCSAGLPWSVLAAEVTKWQTTFTGQIEEVKPHWEYDEPVEARLRITASGASRRTGRRNTPLQSALRRMVTRRAASNSVVAYWPLEDGRDSDLAYGALPGVQPGIMSMAKAADNSLSSSLPLPNAPAGQPFGWNFTVPDHTIGTEWAVDWMALVPTGAATLDAGPLQVIRTTSPAAREFRLSASATQWRCQVVDSLGAIIQTTTVTAGAFFGPWSLLRFEAVQDGGDIDWTWRWVNTDTGISTSIAASLVGVGSIGKVAGLANLFPAAPPDGITVGHFIVSTNSDLGWLAPADTGFVGEPAAKRYRRLCEEEGVPVVILGDETQTEPMGPQRPLTLPVLLQECVAADLGLQGDQRHGLGLVYRPRYTLYNQDPAVVLDRARRALTPPFEPADDDQRIVNEYTATRPAGASVTFVDPAFDPQADDRFDGGDTLNVAVDGQLLNQAAWRVHLGTHEGLRYASLSTDPVTAPHIQDQILHLALGDRVLGTHLPAGHPGDVDVLVEGIDHEPSAFDWPVTLAASPGPPWIVGVLDDTVLGRLDSDGSELASQFIAGTGTSMSVAVTAGPLWATAGGEFPFDILVAGVRLTVTAISGASSPQTFTVVQAPVNGITKTIPAGTKVELADPLILAL